MPPAKHPESAPPTYYSAVLQVLTADTSRAFTVTEIVRAITEAHPLAPDRRSVIAVLTQLQGVPLVTVSRERRYANCIPVSVYQYKH